MVLVLAMAGLVINGVIDILGLGAIVPFVAIVSDPTLVDKNHFIHWLYSSLGFRTAFDFTVAFGVGVILFLVLSNLARGLITYFTIRYAKLRLFSLSVKMYERFLFQPYEYFLQRNTSEFVKRVQDDIPRTIDAALEPVMNILARGVVVLGLISLLFLSNPIVALVISLSLGMVFGLLQVFFRRPLTRIGRETNALIRARQQNIFESLQGIKDVKFSNQEDSYLQKFREDTLKMSRNDTRREMMAVTPRFIVETFAFGGMVGIILFLLLSGNVLKEILPLLGLYTVAGYRLLPYLQSISADLAKTKFGAVRMREVVQTIEESRPIAKKSSPNRVIFQQALQVRDLHYRYPTSTGWVLDGVDLTIKHRTMIGFAGSSGAGKSTLIDVLLGLLEPPAGSLLVDGVPLDATTMAGWRTLIGYVPQQIFLKDASIEENIAYGTPINQIDKELVRKVAAEASLLEFIEKELPDGFRTRVGERGVRLSGGQRQRLGIARALYRKPEVLIFDEASSALDTVTEGLIMESIAAIGKNLTVLIVAHRITTLRNCDNIYLLEKGKVSCSGTFEELKRESRLFQDFDKEEKEQKEARPSLKNAEGEE